MPPQCNRRSRRTAAAVAGIPGAELGIPLPQKPAAPQTAKAAIKPMPMAKTGRPAMRRESAAGAIAAKKPVRAKSNLLNRFNLIWVVQLSLQIYTSSLSPQISGYFRAVPSRQEGRIAIVTNARRDVVDAAALGARRDRRAGFPVSEHGAQDDGAEAYGKTVWS
jgi:hypothetical protein